MPIHGPRKDTRRKNKWETDRSEGVEDFDKMLNNWLMDTQPHKFSLHFPDYSCCYPALKATDTDKRRFVKAMVKLDIPVIERLRQQFEGALWAYAEKHAKTTGKGVGSAEDGSGVDTDTRSA